MSGLMGGLRAGRRRAVAALAISVAGISAFAAGAGAQPQPAPFSAGAEAAGVRLSGTGQNAPVTNTFLDLGGPVSQASLDSLATSTGLAANPFPGDSVISGPGLVAGLSNGQLTPPEYPFAVRSRHPSVPEQRLRQPGGVELEAVSTASESRAIAIGGSPGRPEEQPLVAGARTEAVVRVESDAVVARSSAVLQGVAFGPLRIAQLTSNARVLRQGTGDFRPQATLEVVGAAIGDQRLDVTEHGLVLGGQEAATPAPPPAVLESLEAEGISIRYLAGQAQGHVATSPGLVISGVREVPGSPVSPVEVSLVLGRASATFTDVAGDEAGIGVPAPETAAPSGMPSGSEADAAAGTLPEVVRPETPGDPGTPGAAVEPEVSDAGGDLLSSSFPPLGAGGDGGPQGALAAPETSPARGPSDPPGALAAVPVSASPASGLPPFSGAWAVMVLAGLLGTAGVGAVVRR
ncbi:MAG: hypothetical protein ACRD0O_12305 [Acidimicrobiia bacterium]